MCDNEHHASAEKPSQQIPICSEQHRLPIDTAGETEQLHLPVTGELLGSVAYCPGYQIRQQRDLELVVVQGPRAADR